MELAVDSADSAAVLSSTDLEACKAVSKAEEDSEASKVDAKKDAKKDA